jgi:hypothetical protein
LVDADQSVGTNDDKNTETIAGTNKANKNVLGRRNNLEIKSLNEKLSGWLSAIDSTIEIGG